MVLSICRTLARGLLAIVIVLGASAAPSSLSPTAKPTSLFNTACPAGWTTSSDRCYLLGSGDKTWQDCKAYCSTKSSYLPCIESATQSEFIRNLHPTTVQSWIGLNDIASEGSFVWDNGCTSSYRQWAPNNPDNSMDEDCAGILSAGTWNDGGCANAYGCTCEKLFSSTGSVCPAGWTLSEDGTTCYYFENTASASYSACSSTCTAKGATTLCIQNAAQNAFLWAMRKSKSTWIGLNRVSNPSGAWAWPSGCASTYISWYAGEGTGVGEAQAVMWSTQNGFFADLPSNFAGSASCACQMPAFTSTVAPTVAPTLSPSNSPTIVPSAKPSVSPSVVPTAAPTVLTGVLSSPTYGVKSGFSFAAVGSDGSVRTWGEAGVGGESAVVTSLLTSGVVKVVPSRGAFAALKTNGAVVPWGVHSAIKDENTAHPVLLSVVANEAAFAGITTSGAVYAFGAYQNGGNVLSDAKCNGFSTQLTSGVVSIAASSASFTALKGDGTVYTWGNKYCGGGVSTLTMPALVGVVQVFATSEAFAALLSTGAVYTWGGKHGGDSSAVAAQLTSGVEHIIASKSVFVAFKRDTSIVVWGNPLTGGDTTSVAYALAADVKFVAHTFLAMAALKTDGSVLTWGDRKYGGDSSAVQSELVSVSTIVGNGYAFAALTAAGGVVTWGDAAYGGQFPSNKVSALSSGVVSIYHTNRAFAALKTGGTVVVWGQAGHGGSPGAAVEALLVSGVHTICSNDAAFSVIKTDGSVVGWGHPVSIPIAGLQLTSSALQSNVVCA